MKKYILLVLFFSLLFSNIVKGQARGIKIGYIDMEYIKSSMQKIDIREERFNGFDCWIGVDLGSISDITATSTMIQLDNKLYFFLKYYLLGLIITLRLVSNT